MELQFTLTPAHTALRREAALQREVQALQRQQTRVVAQVAQWQRRWLGPVLFWLGLGGGLLLIARPGRALQAESCIAMLVFAALFTLLWRRYAPRLLERIHVRQARHTPPLQGLHQRLTRRMLQTTLQREEGLWCLQLDAQGFTLARAAGGARRPGRPTRVAWTDIVRGQATPDFYCLTARGRTYHLPRHSDAMDPALYQQQLALWLQHCPVALDTAALTPPTASSAPDR